MSDKKEDVRFVSRSGGPTLVALLSGHTISISHEQPGTPLPERFHKAAMARGCVPAAVAAQLDEASTESTELPENRVNKQEVLINAISQMVQEASESTEKQKALFTNDGKPSATVLASRVGMQVTSGERDSAWEQFTKDL